MTKLKIILEALILKTKNFLRVHQLRFIFLLICFMVLSLFSQFPYFNLILSPLILLFLLCFISIFLFKLPGRFSIEITLVLFLFCFFFLILKNEEVGKKLADLIYALLWVGIIQEFFVYLEEEKI